MVIVNTIVYVQSLLGGNAQTYTTVLMAYGCGSMLVAILLPRLLQKLSLRRVMFSGVGLSALAASLVILQPALPELLLLWWLMGAGSALVMTPGGLLLRRSSQEQDRVALFAAQFALSHAGWLVMYPLAGWLGITVGLGPAFLMMAMISLACGFIALRLWPSSADSAEQEHAHSELSHEHAHVHDEHHQHEHQGWEGPEPHCHPHYHRPLRHRHVFVIDDHHSIWPR
jgi:MFS family permease